MSKANWSDIQKMLKTIFGAQCVKSEMDAIKVHVDLSTERGVTLGAMLQSCLSAGDDLLYSVSIPAGNADSLLPQDMNLCVTLFRENNAQKLLKALRPFESLCLRQEDSYVSALADPLDINQHRLDTLTGGPWQEIICGSEYGEPVLQAVALPDTGEIRAEQESALIDTASPNYDIRSWIAHQTQVER